jgi:GTP-binding protein Era
VVEPTAPPKPPKVPEVFPPVEPDIAAEDGVFRAGYIALVGRPNVGKSTLLNALLGQKLAATTPKPQTTRKNLLGVLNPPGAQLLLLDTPGHHEAKGPLNRFMVGQAEQAIADADVVGYVVEARGDEKVTPGNERLLEILQQSGKRVVVIINKVDKVKAKEGLLLQMQALSEVLGERLAAVVAVSASRRSGLERLVVELGRALPPGERFFDEDTLTDQSERSIVAELIREKVMLATQEELPYAAAVSIDLFEDLRPRLVRIIATIHVERDSQKPIVIGKAGERIKGIGIRARAEIEAFVGGKVYLELHVRVTSDWSNNRRLLAELGYTEERVDGAAYVLDVDDDDEDAEPAFEEAEA